MENQKYLAELRELYIETSRLYLKELQRGASLKELSTLAERIQDLVKEIQKLEDRRE